MYRRQQCVALAQLGFETIEVDEFVLERASRERFGPIEPTVAGDRQLERQYSRRQLGDYGQRKITTDPVDAGKQDSGPHRPAHHAARQREAPQRARQKHIEPGFVTELAARARHSVLQPRVPVIDEVVADAALKKIAVARQLAVEAGRARPYPQ